MPCDASRNTVFDAPQRSPTQVAGEQVEALDTVPVDRFAFGNKNPVSRLQFALLVRPEEFANYAAQGFELILHAKWLGQRRSFVKQLVEKLLSLGIQPLDEPLLYLLLTHATWCLAPKVFKKHPGRARPVEATLAERHIPWQRPGSFDKLKREARQLELLAHEAWVRDRPDMVLRLATEGADMRNDTSGNEHAGYIHPLRTHSPLYFGLASLIADVAPLVHAGQLSSGCAPVHLASLRGRKA